jgi:putative PIN family toxin of toxin-antitoxin system
MRVVIDTNVVVSAALKDRDPEVVILFIARHPEFEWVASEEIVAEYVSVLGRPKFRLPETVTQRWAALFDKLITQIEVISSAEFSRDPKDAKFIACALAAQAGFFITGDRDFQAYKIENTTILPVSTFKKLICDHW